MKILSGSAQSDIKGVIGEMNRLQMTLDYTDFDLKRLRKKALTIKENVSLDYGFAILGMIASLESDPENMKSYFDRAVQQSGGSPEHLFNYSRSLKYFNLYDEAYEKAFAAYQKDQANFGYLDNLIQMVCFLNRSDDFHRYVRLWNNMKKEKHPLENEPLLVFENIREYLRFITDNPGLKVHESPQEFIDKCFKKLSEIFGTPLAIVINIMPDEEWDPTLVAWVQWHGQYEDGMERYFTFEEWYVEEGLDQETDLIHFSIEFPEERCVSIGQN